MQRRELLKLLTAVPALAALPRWAFTADGMAHRDRLVFIYLRGGADGLTLCPPIGDPHYYDLRPTLAIAEADALALDVMFGLHPAAVGLKTLFDAGELAVVHACGLATAQRSHFAAQSATEQGIDATDAAFGSGWLGRYLQAAGGATPLAAIALASAVPQSMGGFPPALAMSSVDGFGLQLDGNLRGVLRSLYAADRVLEPTAESVFAAADALGPVAAIAPGAGYPEGELGGALADAGRLIRANVGLEAVALNFGGWDHHDNQLAGISPLVAELGDALAAFRDDIGAEWERTVVVVQSEFGRRAAENASAGTDHGHGGVMLVAGGGVAGGQVLGQWPGLGPAELSGGEDLAVTTDYRQVLAEMLVQRLLHNDLAGVFGDWQPAPWQGIFLPRAG